MHITAEHSKLIAAIMAGKFEMKADEILPEHWVTIVLENVRMVSEYLPDLPDTFTPIDTPVGERDLPRWAFNHCPCDCKTLLESVDKSGWPENINRLTEIDLLASNKEGQESRQSPKAHAILTKTGQLLLWTWYTKDRTLIHSTLVPFTADLMITHFSENREFAHSIMILLRVMMGDGIKRRDNRTNEMKKVLGKMYALGSMIKSQ